MHFFENSDFNNIALHWIGNKGEGERLKLSKTDLIFEDEVIKLLSLYFLTAFKSEEYYQLHHNSALSLNEVYTYV